MVKERMDLLEILRKRGMDGDVDFPREAMGVLVEAIMDAEVTSKTGAGPVPHRTWSAPPTATATALDRGIRG